MSESIPSIQLTNINTTLHAPLQAAVSAVQLALGATLAGVTVVGSCLTPDYQAKRSDINTVLLLTELKSSVLDAITQSLRPLARKHRLALPLLMTPDHLERSRDVFGIELLDFQLTHQTILGIDPFADLMFTKPEVRLQCERELKADLIRLRQGYLRTTGKDAFIRDLLTAGIKSLAPLLRAMLWLKDQSRDSRWEATWQGTAQTFGVDISALQTVAAWRFTKATAKGPELRTIFARVYDVIDELATLVDGLEVSV